MPTMNWTLTRDDEDIDVVLEYEVAKLIPAQTYGPPENCSPAEGGEVTDLVAAHAETGALINLTDDEASKAELYIYDHHNYDDADDYDDYDDGNVY